MKNDDSWPYPRRLQTVLDGTDPRALAEFYRQLLGLTYRAGDEPVDGDNPDWLVLLTPAGDRSIAFQLVDRLPETTWPQPGVPQQMHFDLTVRSRPELDVQGCLQVERTRATD